MRSEGLLLAPALCLDDGALAQLSHAVVEVAEVRHPTLRLPRQLDRLKGPGSTAVLVSDYVPGLRLEAWLAAREGVPPPTGSVLHIARQVLAGLGALHSASPAIHHGAVSLDRVILTADGRVLLADTGLGFLLNRLGVFDPAVRWSSYHSALPAVSPPGAPTDAADACQVGVLTLELLLGRRLSPDDYPGGLAFHLGAAHETDLLGKRLPLGRPLFEWLSLALCVDGTRGILTVARLTEALDELLADETGYVAVPVGLDVSTETLMSFPFPVQPTLLSIAPPPVAPQGGRPSADGEDLPARSEQPVSVEPHEAAGIVWEHASARQPAAVAVEPEAIQAPATAIASRGERATPSSPGARHRGADGAADAVRVDTPRTFFGTGGAPHARSPIESALRAKRDWRTLIPGGGVAILLTLLLVGGGALIRSRTERTIGQATGTVNVESRPDGATILIDGVERGKAPLSLALPPGPHRVSAKSAQGAGETSIEVMVGQVLDLALPLQFGTDPGFIDINTDPPGAIVTLDGEARGRSPLSMTNLAPGEHDLTVEMGAAKLQRRFTLAPAERLTLYVPLAGWLTVRSRVPVEVLDRGQAVGLSNAGKFLVPAGRRRLQFVNDEYGVNTSQDVVIRAGQQADLTVPLAHGRINVTTDVPADVWVDGQFVSTAPVSNLQVPVGEHEVFVSHPEYGDQRLTVIVGMGAPTRLSIRLDSGSRRQTANQRSPKRSGISAAR